MLGSPDVTFVDGLPVRTMVRTIADLIEDVDDLVLVAAILPDPPRNRGLDLERLRSLLAPLALRNGLEKGDGAALALRANGEVGSSGGSVAACGQMRAEHLEKLCHMGGAAG